MSSATNLAPGDTNGRSDIFVHDNRSGDTARVSVSMSGAQGNGDSGRPEISGDGRYVVFESDASNLVAGDANNLRDVFVRDRVAGTTELVSVTPDGSMSGNGQSQGPVMSADGRWVAFGSTATNLIASGPGPLAVYLRDRSTGTTVVAADDGSGFALLSTNFISPDGRFVGVTPLCFTNCFGSTLEVWDHVTNAIETYHENEGESAGSGSMPADDSLLVYAGAIGLRPGDTPDYDIWVVDRVAHTERRLFPGADGQFASAAISSDARYVAFDSNSTNLVAGVNGNTWRTYLHDLLTGTTRLGSTDATGKPVADTASLSGFSADGRYVVFSALRHLPTGGAIQDLYTSYAIPPTVLSVAPMSVPVGHSTLVLTGTGFVPNMVVQVSAVSNVQTTLIAPDRLALSFDSTVAGPRDVTLTAPGTGPGSNAGATTTCTHCFTIS